MLAAQQCERRALHKFIIHGLQTPDDVTPHQQQGIQIKDRLCVKGGRGKKRGIACPDERP